MKIILLNCRTVRKHSTCSDDDDTRVFDVQIWVTVQRASVAAANAHALLQDVSVIQMCAATAGLGMPLCICLVKINLPSICCVFVAVCYRCRIPHNVMC
jgi:hypothetical protein